jgi:hypothetical protein
VRPPAFPQQTSEVRKEDDQLHDADREQELERNRNVLRRSPTE